MPNNQPIPGHPLVGTTHVYHPASLGFEQYDPDLPENRTGGALVVGNGMDVQIKAVFQDWNGVPWLDMFYVFCPATGVHTHVTPADLGLPSLAQRGGVDVGAAVNANLRKIGSEIQARRTGTEVSDEPDTEADDNITLEHAELREVTAGGTGYTLCVNANDANGLVEVWIDPPPPIRGTRPMPAVANLRLSPAEARVLADVLRAEADAVSALPDTARFPKGSILYVVDQQGATFVLRTVEEQAEVFVEEHKRGAVDLTAFMCKAPTDLTGDQAADYACSHGPDREDR